MNFLSLNNYDWISICYIQAFARRFNSRTSNCICILWKIYRLHIFTQPSDAHKQQQQIAPTSKLSKTNKFYTREKKIIRYIYVWHANKPNVAIQRKFSCSKKENTHKHEQIYSSYKSHKRGTVKISVNSDDNFQENFKNAKNELLVIHVFIFFYKTLHTIYYSSFILQIAIKA